MMFKIEIADSTAQFSCASGDTLTRAGLRAGVGMPYECNVGSCGTCKVELLSGSVRSAWPDAPGLSERDKAKNRVLGCQSLPQADCRIKVRASDEYAPLHVPRRFEATLTGWRDVTHDIREFHLQSDNGLAFRPGQYALFSLPGCTGQRAYSMSNCPGTGSWHFQIKRVPNGQGTGVFFDQLSVGERLALDGPYGIAYLREDNARDIVCIAGGSGISPMLSIARAAMRSPVMAGREIHFFYGGRRVADICGAAELSVLDGFGTRLHYHPAISMSDAGGESEWQGRVGLVHEQVLAILPAPAAAYEYYFAGPPLMTTAVQRLLVENKVPFAQMHFDRFF